MKMKLKLKNRSHRYELNRPRPRHGNNHTNYKMCLSIMMIICIKHYLRTFEAQFMRKLSKKKYISKTIKK